MGQRIRPMVDANRSHWTVVDRLIDRAKNKLNQDSISSVSNSAKSTLQLIKFIINHLAPLFI